MKIKVGDMIHVPAETTIYKAGEQSIEWSWMTETLRLSEPAKVLVIDEHTSFYEILNGGAPWLVKKKNAYGL